MFEFRDLKWLVVVAEQHSLHRAAAILRVRESALSRRMRRLEDRMQVQLLERGRRGTQLTPAGLEMYTFARRILDDADTTTRRVKSRGNRRRTSLSVGLEVAPSIGNLPSILSEFHRQFPEVDLHLTEDCQDTLLALLKAGDLDLAIVADPTDGWDDRQLPLWQERVVAAVPVQHPLADRTTIDCRDLITERLLLPARGPGTALARLIEARLHGASPQIMLEEASVGHILSLVRIGYGTLLTLESATGLHVDGVIYRMVQDRDVRNGTTWHLPITACWNAGNKKPALKSFLPILEERYPDLSVRLHER